MTTAANLLALKQKLLEQLAGDPAPDEREQIDRQLEKIDTALNLLDRSTPRQE